MTKKLIFSFILISFCFLSNAQVKMNLGIYIKNININNVNKTFYADFYWWCKLPKTIPDSLVEEYVNFEIVNSRSIKLDITEKLYLDSLYYFTGTCKGDFLFNPDFKEYPVDKQSLPLIFESATLPIDLLILSPDYEAYAQNKLIGLASDFNLPNFNIISSNFDKESKIYRTNFGDPNFEMESTFSRLTYRISLERISKFYILKILIPCFILTVISYLVFYIPSNDLGVAVGCTVTALLACIALQLSISDDLSEIGYITSSDKLFYFFYSLISLALIETVIANNLDRQGKTRLSFKLKYASRIIYPIILMCGILILI